MIGFISGIANALRGKGFIKTWVFNVFVGSQIALLTINAEINTILHFALCISGIAIWKAAGWGLYFSAFNGYWDVADKEIKWIDDLGYSIYPFTSKDDLETNRKRGRLCMAIRGAVYSIPLFLYLSLVLQWYACLLWPAMLMQGVFYWLAYWVRSEAPFGDGYRVIAAEASTIWFMIDLVRML